MKSRAVRVLGVAAATAILLLMPAALLADGQDGDGALADSAAGLAPDIPEIFVPATEEAPSGLLASPFTLLSPIQGLLSSSVWVTATGQDPRADRLLSSRTRQPGISAPGLAWDSLREVFTAPAAPPIAPAVQGGVGLVPFRDPAPAFSRNILITRDFSDSPLQTEPSIAVDPNDPEHLLLGTIDYNFPNVSTYVSIDGGVTWEGPYLPNYLKDDLGSGGDPVVAFDREGTAYLNFISIGVEEFTVGPAADSAVISSIGVARSEDGGRSWEEPVSAARAGVEKNFTVDDLTGRVTGDIAIGFLDKPWMTVGPAPDGGEGDIIYVTYTEFIERFRVFYIGDLPFFGVPLLETVIRMVHSEDGGRSWSEPINVSPLVRRVFADASAPEAEEADSAPLQQPADAPVGTKRVVQGSQPAVGPDGTLYVTWLDSTDDDSMEGLAEVYVAKSTDGGETLSDPVRVAVFNEPGFTPRKGFFRYWGSAFPQIAVGPEGGVFIVYTAVPSDKDSDDGDIYMTRSLDGGDIWSRPLRLNDDETERLQFFPSVATDPNGTVHVMWGDMRDDRAETKYHIYYTSSEDKGQTIGFTDDVLGIHTANTRVTDFPSNPNRGFPGGRFIGDYFSIKATADDVYLVWADTRLGEFGPTNQKIGFARRSAIRSPEVFLNPPAGPGGQPVTLQGFNFQPDINVFIRVGGVIVTSARTNLEGRFTSQVFVPISGRGAHEVQVFDDSGNRAASSFFMEFGFDDIQSSQQELAKRVEGLEESIETIGTGLAGTMEAELQTMKTDLEAALLAASAAQVPAPAPPSEPTPVMVAAAVSETSDGTPVWLWIVGFAVAGAVSAAATAIVLRLTRSKGAPPDRWSAVS